MGVNPLRRAPGLSASTPTEAPLILASASARRRDLLASLGLGFEIMPSEVDESRRVGEAPPDYVSRLAYEKAADIRRKQAATGDSRAVLGADTSVVMGDEVLGKPRDMDDARWMLRTLSGATHEVLTGVCLLAPAQDVAAHELELVRTEVTFSELSGDEIERYLAVADWHDKAGGYAVQEHAAYMVREIRGSYTNVVGLPLAETVAVLRRAGLIAI